MGRIIYSSKDKIEWDAQSVFKITNYYTELEDHMIFCYIRQYLQNGDLKLCTYCFEKEAAGKKDFELSLNLNPEKSDNYLHLRFGFDGIDSFEMIAPQALSPDNVTTLAINSSDITHSSHMANDQQGHYWCAEITLNAAAIDKLFNTRLAEKSIILLNLYKIFENSADYASLFADPENDKLNKAPFMQEFVILKY